MNKNLVARFLIIFGAILQLIYLGANSFFTLILFVIALLGSLFIPGDPLLPLAGMTIVSMTISVLTGLIFLILWFVWATNPGKNRKWLILTGFLGILFGGLIPATLAFLLFGTTWPTTWITLIMTSFLPGLLVLIGGLISQSSLEA